MPYTNLFKKGSFPNTVRITLPNVWLVLTFLSQKVDAYLKVAFEEANVCVFLKLLTCLKKFKKQKHLNE